MNGTNFKRLSQENERYKTPINSIMEEAKSVAQRVLESIQAIAGTTDCKGVQVARLAEWAKQKGYWINDASSLGDYADRGSENEVYLSNKNDFVYKLNDFRYSDDNLMPFFERIKAQNIYFPYCSYTLIGFGMNKEEKVCAIVQQPYIISSREATKEEIRTEMKRLGFNSQMDGEYYTNGTHDIFDASPSNVLVGIDGNLYFIDTIIYKSDENNLETYRSQSPHLL